MRILRIADVPDNRTGGMSRTMYCTGDALIARGHIVDYLFAGRFTLNGPVQLRRFLVPLHIPVLVRQLAAVGKTPDVVEIHEPSAAIYAWHRRRSSSWPPLVIFSYGLEERSHEAMLSYKRLKGLPVSLKNRYSPLSVVWQARYAVRHADHVICSSSEDVRHLQAAGVLTDRLTQHHSGVAPEFLVAGAQSPLPDRSGILFLGSWLVRKGTIDLVTAINRLLPRHPQLRLTVAGCGTDPCRVLAEFPESFRSRIDVIPHISGNDKLIEVYRRHSIFVLPSYFEGQPLVMIEAAALRLAMVMTNVCGMADFIEDGRNGFAVAVGDAEQLARRLAELVASPALASQLGEAAWKTAQTHTWTAAALKIEEAYQKAAAR